MKLDLEKWKYKVKQLNNEVERLKTMVEKVRSDQATTSQSTPIRYRLKKMVLGKNPGCRVMAYNKNNMLLVSVKLLKDNSFFVFCFSIFLFYLYLLILIFILIYDIQYFQFI